MKELLEKLLSATGPDRRLDTEIGLALDIETAWSGDLRQLGYAENVFIALGAQPYTASIDAALTLVPDGWAWALHHHRDCTGANAVPFAKVSRASWNKRHNEAEFYKEAHSRGATPAIAICIAALKARIAVMDEMRSEK